MPMWSSLFGVAPAPAAGAELDEATCARYAAAELVEAPHSLNACRIVDTYLGDVDLADRPAALQRLLGGGATDAPPPTTAALRRATLRLGAAQRVQVPRLAAAADQLTAAAQAQAAGDLAEAAAAHTRGDLTAAARGYLRAHETLAARLGEGHPAAQQPQEACLRMHLAHGDLDAAAWLIELTPELLANVSGQDAPELWESLFALAADPLALPIRAELAAAMDRLLTAGTADPQAQARARQARLALSRLGPRAVDSATWQRRLDAVPDLPAVARDIAGTWAAELDQLAPAQHHEHLQRLALVCELPWDARPPQACRDPEAQIARARAALDAAVCGMQPVKSRLLDTYARSLRSGGSRGGALLLEGAPGIGKTTILSRGLEAAFRRPVIQIPLAGQEHAAMLTGLAVGFQGCHPGAILKALVRTQVPDPIVFFDEVDKVDVVRARTLIETLLLLTDPIHARQFQDAFVEGITFDLSQVLWVFACNDAEQVNGPLRDRLEFIEVPSPTRDERVHAARHVLVPSVIAEAGLRPADLYVDDALVAQVVDAYDDTDGLRRVRRALAELVGRANTASLGGQLSLPACLSCEVDGAAPRFVAHGAGSAARLRALPAALAESRGPSGVLATLTAFADVLPQVTALDLSGRDLTDASLAAVGEVLGAARAPVQHLWLGSNALTRLAPAVDALPSLTHLYASHNALHGPTVGVAQATALRVLHLHENPLTTLPADCGALSLEELWLDSSLRELAGPQPGPALRWHIGRGPSRP